MEYLAPLWPVVMQYAAALLFATFANSAIGRARFGSGVMLASIAVVLAYAGYLAAGGDLLVFLGAILAVGLVNAIVTGIAGAFAKAYAVAKHKRDTQKALSKLGRVYGRDPNEDPADSYRYKR